MASVKEVLDAGLNFRGREGASLDLGELDGVEKELGPKKAGQVATVHFRNQNFLVPGKDLLQIVRKRPKVPDQSVWMLPL